MEVTRPLLNTLWQIEPEHSKCTHSNEVPLEAPPDSLELLVEGRPGTIGVDPSNVCLWYTSSAGGGSLG